MKTQESIYLENDIFKIAQQVANKENRTKNFILARWIKLGMTIELNTTMKDDKDE